MKMAKCCPQKLYHCKDMCLECYAKSGHQRRMRDPSFRAANKARAKKWYADNPEKARLLDANKHLKRSFGITLNDYEILLAGQNGVCALCKNPESVKSKRKVQRLAVDHCHKTQRIRGLLCFKCNTSIAILEKDSQLLDLIKVYLGGPNV